MIHNRSKQEVMRYDIFKGIVTGLLLLTLFFLASTGQVEIPDGVEVPDDVAALPLTAPELLSPAPGSVVEPGEVTFSGMGVPDSTVALLVDGMPAADTAVAPDGSWQAAANLAEGQRSIELQTLNPDGNVAAAAPAFSLQVGAPEEEDVEAPAPDVPAELAPDAAPLAVNAPASGVSEGLVTLSGTGQPGFEVALSVDGLDVGSTTVADDGTWAVELPLAAGAYAVSARQITPDGAEVGPAEELEVSVAEVSPPTVDLPDDDVFAGPLTLSGTGAAGSRVALYAGSTPLGEADVSSAGTWELPVELPPGDFEIDIAAINPDGSESERLPAISLPVLATASAPTLDLLENGRPTFNALTGLYVFGGSAEPGSRVGLLNEDDVLQSTSVDSSGRWQLQQALEPGTYRLATAVLGEDDTVLSQSEPVDLDVTAGLPSFRLPPFVLGGASPEDETPTLTIPRGDFEWTGIAEPGAEVAIVVDDNVIGQATTGDEGDFGITTNLPGGQYNVQLGQVDDEGALSGASAVLPLFVADTDLPTFTLPAFLIGGGDSEASGEDGEPAAITGTASPGALVQLISGGVLLAEVVADETGNWLAEVDPELLRDQSGDLYAQVVDEDGNVLLASNPQNLSPEAAAQTDATVTGTITYIQRIALQPGSTITVQIQDTSLADAPATVIGEQVIEIEDQQVPVPYEVGYNTADIVDNNSYTMSARITDPAGELIFINDTAIPVITRGNPTEDVEIMTVAVGAPDDTAAEQATVTGTVTYLERSALPDDAVVKVSLQDVSTPGAAATVLGEQEIVTDGTQVPIPFEIVYDPAAIVDSNTYAVRARIEDADGNLLFTSDTVIPVITNDNPTEDVEIMTVSVQPQEEPEVTFDDDAETAAEAVEDTPSAATFNTLIAGLDSAGLLALLSDADAAYTLFAPTDAAFLAVPSELVAAWDANPARYGEIMSYLVVEGAFPPDALEDGQVLQSLANTNIGVGKDGDKVIINGVPTAGYVEAGNSVVYGLNQIVLPPLRPGIAPPIIDEEGVPVFKGPLLTVVGTAEPGKRILLQVDGENFGDIATVDETGFWLVKQDIDSGVHEILAYMIEDDGTLMAISQLVILPVP